MSEGNEWDETLAAFAAGESAPENLRVRIVDELEARGAVGPVRWHRGWWVAAAVAAVLLGSLPFFRWSAPAPGSTYVLILDTVTRDYSQMSPEEAAPLAAAYTRWIEDVDSRGRLKGSYYLASTSSTSGLDAVSGILVLEASSRDEVEAIAAESPHVRRGGTISIRELASPP